MKKSISLIKATMSNDMKLFKIYYKKNEKIQQFLPVAIALYLMFMIWCSANTMFEKVTPFHLQVYLLVIFAFSISVITFMEGIYKGGSLLFKCKDDSLLLSLPISKRTILFTRLLKFYLFEVLFNALFLLPIMIAYIRWADSLSFTYFITSMIFLLLLPIIPIILSCIIGVITTGIGSYFKNKKIIQTILSMSFLIVFLLLYANIEKFTNYFIKNISNINEALTKFYYPVGMYLKLLTDFKIVDLLSVILIHIIVVSLFIFILEKLYFKINTKIMAISTSKTDNHKSYKIKKHSQKTSLVIKELKAFFNTPVLIINAGFALVLFLLVVFYIIFRIDIIMNTLTKVKELHLTKDTILENSSLYIFLLIAITSFMTSITNSLISLEGKSINILKSLPIKAKTILLAKIETCLIITTPVLFLGIMILFIRLKLKILDTFFLLILAILIPLASHFIGLIVNLKYPKLDASNSTEVVKQSMSSFLSVMIGMILLMITYFIVTPLIGKIKPIIILLLASLIFCIIDSILYYILIKIGAKDFHKLSI